MILRWLKMSRVLAIVGESGSGKDTIKRALCKLHDFKSIVSYTTRSPRLVEREGIDYHFIPNEEFEAGIRIKLFAEWTKYEGDRYYGSLKSDYLDCGKDIIKVLTPDGIRQLKRNNPDLDIFTVYVTAPLRVRAQRYISRCADTFSIADMTELSNRTQRDSAMFIGMDQEADIVVNNTIFSIEDAATCILEKFNG